MKSKKAKKIKKVKLQNKKKRVRYRKRKKKQNVSFFRWFVKWMFVFGLWSVIFLTGLIAWYAGELPDITKQVTFEHKTSMTIKSADGSIITHYGETKGQNVSVEKLPPHLIYAVLSIEDRRFYQHFGIDLQGISRAMLTNVIKGRFVQGGSTITQQLAKNIFLSKERTIKRKIQEALLALWLERELTKDEIMSAYLNRVYLGSGTYGVEAASKRYFNKPVANINVQEAALLAGLLKAPSRYSPLKNPDLSKERTKIVLNTMVKAGYITKALAGKYTPLSADSAQIPSGTNTIRYYTDWIVDGINDLIGTPPDDLIIETTLNPEIQKAAEKALTNILNARGEIKKISQGAIIVMRPNGAVVAMVGGANYSASQFNRVTQAKRQPGSAFKPILYLTALEKGWKPSDTIIDAPIENQKYRPKNFNEKYYGEVTLEKALTHSMNTAAIRLMQDIGVRSTINTAKRLGIYSPLQANLSLALGSGSLSPMEISTAYAVIANGGRAVYPYAITKITDQNGELYYERPKRNTTRRIVQKHHVKSLTSMMRMVIQEGTGRRASLDFKTAGKTGTSQDNRDAWFTGFNDEIITTVWLGNDDNSPMQGVTGSSHPAEIWRDVMNVSHNKYKPINNKNFNETSFRNLLSRILPGNNKSSQINKARNYND